MRRAASSNGDILASSVNNRAVSTGSAVHTGVTKVWNHADSFCYIEETDGSQDRYCHISSILNMNGSNSLEAGSRVSFVRSKRSNGAAEQVTVIQYGAPTAVAQQPQWTQPQQQWTSGPPQIHQADLRFSSDRDGHPDVRQT